MLFWLTESDLNFLNISQQSFGICFCAISYFSYSQMFHNKEQTSSNNLKFKLLFYKSQKYFFVFNFQENSKYFLTIFYVIVQFLSSLAMLHIEELISTRITIDKKKIRKFEEVSIHSMNVDSFSSVIWSAGVISARKFLKRWS